MKFRTAPGKKGEGDEILLVQTNGEEAITHKELFEIVKHFYNNEDKIYPPPAKGSKMLMESLIYLRSHSIRETLLKCQSIKAEFLSDFI
jgi:hypothetical protein